MTEETKSHTLWPNRTICFPAFFLALVAAPFVSALLFFWMVIPVFALFFGLPFYLALGTPLLLWFLGGARRSGGEIAALAFVSHLVFFGLVLAILHATGNTSFIAEAQVFLFCGAITAPIWGGIFGWLYTGLTEHAARKTGLITG